MRMLALSVGTFAVLIAVAAAGTTHANTADRSVPGEDDPAWAILQRVNEQLAERGLPIRAAEMEFFTIGVGRPSVRIVQTPLRWVPNDPRRLADGTNLTYLSDASDGATSSGLTSSQTGAAIDRAMLTWAANMPSGSVQIIRREDGGGDPDIYDWFLGFGGFGNPFLADIVHAGWLPKGFFDLIAPGGGDLILAHTITFIFVNPVTGVPTDINSDQYLDTSLTEVYYNDNFGDPGGTQPSFPWGIDVSLPGIDVETVALHESGHTLGLGHFGPPPAAVMNPIYDGIRQTVLPLERAGLRTLYSSWPHQ